MNLTQLEAFGRYIEQPRVIRDVGKWALGLGSIGGVTALTGADTYNAQPQDRQKVLVRDGLVLGATLAGTALATRKLMPLPSTDDAKVAVNFIRENLAELLGKEDGKRYHDALNPLVKNLEDKEKITRNEFEKIISTINENPDKAKAKEHLGNVFDAREDESVDENFFKRVWHEMTQEADPKKGIEEGEGRKMAHFFAVGGLSVISGLLGGIAANKVNGVKDQDATVNMVKEGIFQFVANIALCAVGASAAIVAMSPKPIATWLEKKGMTGKLLKTGGIGAGLSLGIFGGGVIANKLGTKVINPLCDKIQGKEPQPQTDPNTGKRKIEFWDAILHLDDVPTAMALAGMEIVEPFIPLFFGFSGYRTGIGYRNDPSSKAANGKSQVAVEASAPTFQSSEARMKAQPPAAPQPSFAPNYAMPSYGNPFTQLVNNLAPPVA